MDSSITPWMDVLKKYVGLKEVAGRMANKTIVGFFKFTSYHTTSDETPWCAAGLNACLHEAGYKGTNSAGAASFDHYGIPLLEPSYGAIIRIQHVGGGHHVTTFSRWIDKSKHIGEFLGCNQSNMVKYSIYNVSGNAHGHDQIAAIRWPVK